MLSILLVLIVIFSACAYIFKKFQFEYKGSIHGVKNIIFIISIVALAMGVIFLFITIEELEKYKYTLATIQNIENIDVDLLITTIEAKVYYSRIYSVICTILTIIIFIINKNIKKEISNKYNGFEKWNLKKYKK